MKVDNFWNGDSRFYFMCNNGHKKKNKNGEIEDDHFELVQKLGNNNNVFFACPKYWKYDEEHELGFLDNEHQCKNGLNSKEAEKIIEKLEKEYAKNILFEETDLTDYKFSIGQVDVVVLWHDMEKDKIYLGILNNRTIHKVL